MTNSALGYNPQDMFPGPPDLTGTVEQQIASLADVLAKQAAAFQDYLGLMDTEAQQGFGAGEADEIITELNDNGTITIDGDTINVHGGSIILDDVIDSNGDLDASATTTTIRNNSISISSNGTINAAGGGQVTITGLGYTGDLAADQTALILNNTTITAGAVVYSTSMGTLDDVGDGTTYKRIATTVINSSGILITKVDPGATATVSTGLHLGSDKMGYYNGTAWVSVINSDGTFSFFIDSDNEVSHDGTNLTIKATKGVIDIASGQVSINGEGIDTANVVNNAVSANIQATTSGTSDTWGLIGSDTLIDDISITPESGSDVLFIATSIAEMQSGSAKTGFVYLTLSSGTATFTTLQHKIVADAGGDFVEVTVMGIATGATTALTVQLRGQNGIAGTNFRSFGSNLIAINFKK